jgi:hypothetical protein
MRILIPTLCLLSFAVNVFAQGDRGTITGTVTDPAGAVVPNATIEAKQTDTGALFPTTSTDTGNYTLSQLPVGSYELSVTAGGFKKFVRSNITVQVAQTLRVDVPLEVGASTESVTVSAEASLLKTETGDQSSNIQVQTLDQLPMLSIGAAASGSSGIRNPNNVLNVVPGAYYVPNSQVKINGAQTNSYAYHVEGLDSTNAGFPYAAAQTQPSVDAIQEVSVQTSNFAAEYGAVGGGFFNVTMKSGTNQFHGSGYDYFVNEVLNAGTPFTPDPNHPGNLTRPAARRNDYGWTIGGPVAIPKLYNGRDKTFFFFNFEQFRETQNINNIPITVPTLAYRNGDFSQAIAAANNLNLGTDILGRSMIANTIYDPATQRVVSGQLVADPFPNNAIPIARMDPVALRVQNLIPLPANGNTFQNLTPTYPSTRHTTIPAVKIDHLLGAKQKLSFYWSSTHTDSQFSPTYGNSEGLPTPITEARGSFIHSHVERLNYDYTISPTLLLHAGVGYQQNNFFDDAPVLDYNAAASLGLTGATVNRNFPIFNGFCPTIAGVSNLCTSAGGMYNMGPPGQTHSYWEKPAGNASLTWVRQSHTIKAGTDIYFLAVPQTPFTNTNGAYSFSANETGLPYVVGTTLNGGTLGFPYASFLLGAVDSFGIAAPADFRQAKKQIGVFIQDSWKVSRKLTVDYGLRWDYGTYFQEQYGRSANFSPTTPNPAAGGLPGAFIYEGSGAGHCNCQFASNYPYALGPRVGVAYQITPKTVLRAGWGLIYGQTSTNPLGINAAGVANNFTIGSPGLGTPALTLQNGIPFTPQWPSFNSGVLPPQPFGNQALPTGIVFLDPQAGRPPRQNQWSIGIQREIFPNLLLDVAYVANRGVWWQAPSLIDLNAVTPQILAAHGLNIANPADQQLLSSTLTSSAAASRGFNTAPYVGFSTSNTVAQSLRPYPQFGNIPVSGDPLGKTWYDSLQVKVTKRLSHGFDFTGAFTWAKALQVGVDGNTNTIVTTPGQTAQNYVNNVVQAPFAGKSISSFDQPLMLNIAGSYTVPKISKLGKIASYVFQDWQIGTLLQYSSGLPIPVPAATTSIANQLFQPSLMNRVPGQPLYTVDVNCRCYDPSKTFVLNPAAWANPAPGTFGDSTPFFSDYRYERHPVENMNLGRTWKFKERFTLNLRMEFNNIFNRTFLNNPSATNPFTPQTRNALGLNNGGFGYINTATSSIQQGQPRNGTIVMRVTF